MLFMTPSNFNKFSKNLPWGRRESQAEVMSKIRKRRETSADITIFRKSDNSRLVGINVIKTQPDVNHHICRIPRQDSIGVREEVTTTEISSGGRIGKHQV